MQSLLVTLIVLGCVPTIGYLAAGQVCFAMGLANVPGFKIWREASKRKSRNGETIGMIVGSAGQAMIGLVFAFLLARGAHALFARVEVAVGFRWFIWAALFLLLAGPFFMTGRASSSMSDEDGRTYFYVTLAFSGFVTKIGFICMAIYAS